MAVTINGAACANRPDERLVDLISRSGVELPQVCYHP